MLQLTTSPLVWLERSFRDLASVLTTVGAAILTVGCEKPTMLQLRSM